MYKSTRSITRFLPALLLLVLMQIVPSSFSRAQNLLLEKFGTGGDTPPTGWTNTNVLDNGEGTTSYADVAAWYFDTLGDYAYEGYPGNYGASCCYSPATSFYDYLTDPVGVDGVKTVISGTTTYINRGTANAICYYRAVPWIRDMATKAMDFTQYPSNGGYRLSYYIGDGYYGSPTSSYSSYLYVYANNSPTVTGAVLIDSFFPGVNSTHSLSGFSFSLPAGYAQTGYTLYAYYQSVFAQRTANIPQIFNSSSNVYVIFRAGRVSGQQPYTYNFIVDHVSVDYIGVCSSTPLPPTITTGIISAAQCPGASVPPISASDTNRAVSGVAHIWKYSTVGASGPWTNVPVGYGNGIGTLTYAPPALTQDTWFEMVDSCTATGQTTPSINAWKFPIKTGVSGIPYIMNFSGFSYTPFYLGGPTGVPPCYLINTGATAGASAACLPPPSSGLPLNIWTVNPNYHSADGVADTALTLNDTSCNPGGKNAYFTTPAISMVAGVQYSVKFGFSHNGPNYSIAATGTTGANPIPNATSSNDLLSVYWNYQYSPGIVNSGCPVNQVAPLSTYGPVQLYNTTISYQTYGKTRANLPFIPVNSGPYFFSWCSNTPHPTPSANGTVVGIDSIRIDSVGCLTSTITSQPQSVVACPGYNVKFTVGASAYGLNYQWQLCTDGSGTNWNNIIPSGTYNGVNAAVLTVNNVAAGMSGYQYRVVVGHQCGTLPWTPVNSTAVTLTMATFPTASITLPGGPSSTVLCPGSTSVLQAGTNATGATYQWYNNGNALINASGVTDTVSVSGNYTVAVTNASGCTFTSAGQNIIVNPAPSISIATTGPVTFCNGLNVGLNANQDPIADIVYTWKRDTGTGFYPVLGPGNAYSFASYVATTSGRYTVTETGTNGCSATFSVPVIVTVNGPASAVVTPGSATQFCKGGQVNLQANTGANILYQWYNGTTAINGATQSFYTAVTSGSYNVKLTTNGCPLASAPVAVNVVAPNVNLNSNGTIICAGNAVIMNAATNSSYTYQWSFAGSPITGATGSSYSTTTPGSYSVAIVDGSNGCTDASAPYVLTANTPPPASAVNLGPTNICTGSTVVLQANISSSYTYQWYNNNVAVPGATSSTITASLAGTYTVKVSNGACNATSQGIGVTLIPLPTPTVTATGTTLLCPGGNVTLTTPSLPNQIYQWTVNGSDIAGATGLAYVTSTAGNYAVKVTNSSLCTGSSPNVPVQTFTLPVAHVTPAVTTAICAGLSTTLKADTSVIYSYQWYNGTTPISGATTANLSVNTAGNYKVVVTNVALCVSTSPATTVVVNPLPASSVAPAGSTDVCSGSTTTLSANTSFGFNYQWMLNGVNISGSTASTIAAGSPGNYSVTITDINGCSKVSPATTVIIDPVPSAYVAAPPSDTSICQGGSVTLKANQGSGFLYQWFLNNNPIPGSNSGIYHAYAAGNYTVKVIEGPCSSVSLGRSIGVNALPPDSISYQGATNICANVSVQLNASSGAGYSYQWLYNGAPISGANSSSYGANLQGKYSCVITSNEGCTNTTKQVPVYNFPIPNPAIIANGNSLRTGTFVTYQWNLDGVSLAPAGQANGYVAKQNGDYTVTVTDGNGCTNTSAKYTVTGVTGVSNVNGANNPVKIYPNPTTGIVHIDASFKVNVTVSSIDGRELIHQDDAKEVNLSNLANGVYMINVYNNFDNSLIRIEKLVKDGQ